MRAAAKPQNPALCAETTRFAKRIRARPNARCVRWAYIRTSPANVNPGCTHRHRVLTFPTTWVGFGFAGGPDDLGRRSNALRGPPARATFRLTGRAGLRFEVPAPWVRTLRGQHDCRCEGRAAGCACEESPVLASWGQNRRFFAQTRPQSGHNSRFFGV